MELPCVCLEQVVKLFLKETTPPPRWSLSLRGGGGALPCLASVGAASPVGGVVAFHYGAFFWCASLLGIVWRPLWHPPSVALHLVALEKTTIVLLQRRPSSARAGDVQCCATTEELSIMPADSSRSPSSSDDEGAHHHLCFQELFTMLPCSSLSALCAKGILHHGTMSLPRSPLSHHCGGVCTALPLAFGALQRAMQRRIS